jgi:putative SOS response-associated peptidase YedK
MLRWGLVPSWAEDPKVGGRQINARAESAATRPAFRDSLRYQRCLVVADGFYEWKLDGRVRQPHLLRRQDQQPFAFAGLWARWRRTDQDPDLDTYAILTVPPNALLRPLHDRMPLILEPEAYARWLDRRIVQPQALADLLTTPTSTGWEAVPVSTAINDARFAGDPLTSPLAQVT